MRIELPDKPVDGFTVEWWGIGGDRPEMSRVVYHVNTKWRDYAPKSELRGADLVDDWMHYDPSGRCTGRTSGWKNLWLAQREDATSFPSRQAAIEAAVVSFRKLVAIKTDELKQAKASYRHWLALRLPRPARRQR